ncbi:hypothetical protein VTK73DRAFT_6499 [Phialemonium thermophilum]|uniref:Uncharacterized protein n=1 Tax=Phialemonium thermophilum TaxID=223376 RepID=A0ABR3UZ99_9PEZI
MSRSSVAMPITLSTASARRPCFLLAWRPPMALSWCISATSVEVSSSMSSSSSSSSSSGSPPSSPVPDALLFFLFFFFFFVPFFPGPAVAARSRSSRCANSSSTSVAVDSRRSGSKPSGRVAPDSDGDPTTQPPPAPAPAPLPKPRSASSMRPSSSADRSTCLMKASRSRSTEASMPSASSSRRRCAQVSWVPTLSAVLVVSTEPSCRPWCTSRRYLSSILRTWRSECLRGVSLSPPM